MAQRGSVAKTDWMEKKDSAGRSPMVFVRAVAQMAAPGYFVPNRSEVARSDLTADSVPARRFGRAGWRPVHKRTPILDTSSVRDRL